MSNGGEYTTDTARYFQRRVNPFLGVMAVVKTADGRALSADGRRWQIQVLAHPPRGLWSRGGYQDSLKYFRFGTWAAGEGLRGVPLSPILDAGRMIEVGEDLIASVRGGGSVLPFPLADALELWQLDRSQEPLALLATAIEAADLGEVGTPIWTAGGSDGRPFVSAALVAKGIPERRGGGRSRHAEVLERLVKEASGRYLNRQWFRRDALGRGLGLDHRAPAALAGRLLPAAAFPRFPLRTDWTEEADRQLVADYIAWLAPYLLTLPGLDDAERVSLERQAAGYPLLMESLWRLYPRVLDEDLLKRARVEARLRRANA